MPLKYVGELELQNTVDITDPCYDKDVWCRMTVDCEAGIYKGYVELSDEGEWGVRNAVISIFKGDKIWGVEEMEHIGTIGVDAGLAGFFNNKPDFNDKEWSDFCDELDANEGISAWNLHNGIFSRSGYGDGVYDVYANEDRSAFSIVFIPDEIDIGDMNYSEFCTFLSEDADDRFDCVLSYDDFSVYEDTDTGRFFYLEGGENDASDFYEVELIAKLTYSVVHDLKIPFGEAGITMSKLFDSDMCGERVLDDRIEYLWFSVKE